MADPGPDQSQNILSIDVEDWFELVGRMFRGHGTPRPDRLARQLDRVLGLLAKHDCRATFFCLAGSLRHASELVRRIADAGHEIGTHGWGHGLIAKIGLDAFRQDLRDSIAWLQDLLGRPIRGYRAPAFSVAPHQLQEFYDICMEAGLDYDSSVFPFRGPRYGIPDAPLEPHRVRSPNGKSFTEVPLAVLEWGGRRWPVAGGGYWRLLPTRAILSSVRRLNQAGRPMVTYLHPYEFDAEFLSAVQVAGFSWRSLKFQLKQNLNRETMYSKLDHVLSAHRFGAMEDYLRDRFPIQT